MATFGELTGCLSQRHTSHSPLNEDIVAQQAGDGHAGKLGGRMAEIEQKTKRYPTDLTEEEWARIRRFLPSLAKNGRPVETDLREVLNAIRYLARSGGGWRMLPKDFPPWQTVYWWFRRFVRRFMFQTIQDVALMLDRERSGREASPSGGVIDSQSVKATEAKT